MPLRRANWADGILVARRGNTIFIPLPRELWREIEGGCSCVYCSTNPHKAGPAFWDTLAVAETKPDSEHANDTTWVVHGPDFHGQKPVRNYA
jgi:hypothetical protein